jgi:hypothetical protein
LGAPVLRDLLPTAHMPPLDLPFRTRNVAACRRGECGTSVRLLGFHLASAPAATNGDARFYCSRVAFLRSPPVAWLDTVRMSCLFPGRMTTEHKHVSACARAWSQNTIMHAHGHT